MCDSQAALRALENVDIKSKVALETIQALNSLGKDYTVSLHWIKAHVNHKGNEIEDRAAKTGSMIQTSAEIPVSMAHIKQQIREELYRKWNLRWQTGLDCRQTFQFFPCVDESKSKAICKMSRHDFGIMVRYLTGHAHLRRHNKIANTAQEIYCDLPEMEYRLKDPDDNFTGDFDRSITCRICKLRGREETPLHLAKECLGAWDQRRHLLGCYSYESEDIIPWEPRPLLEFFKRFDLENKPNSL